MLRLDNITFPLYKLRSYLNIETSILGMIKITTIKGLYLFDDASIPGDFEERRRQLPLLYPGEKIYKLKERVSYLRQLVKYNSGTTFVDHNGVILKYRKSSKLYEIRSLKITRAKEHGNWSIINVEGHEQPYIIGQVILPTTTHASIMETKWGPLLYDLTSEKHETYRRKI